MRNKIIIIDVDLWIRQYESYLNGTGFSPFYGNSISEVEPFLKKHREDLFCIFLSFNKIADISRDLTFIREIVDNRIPLFVMYDYQKQIDIHHLQTIPTFGQSECWVKPYNRDKMMELINVAGKKFNGKLKVLNTTGNQQNKILIVDDEEKWRKYLKESFEGELQNQLVIRVMGTLKEAKKEFDKDIFSVVISDLSLDPQNKNDREGFELLEYIRKKDEKRNRKTPIIVVSAGRENNLVADLFRTFGISDYHNKSYFTSSKLRNSVISLLG